MPDHKSLFDPFYGSAKDGFWHKKGTPTANFRATGQNIADEAASLAHQFGATSPGWSATLISTTNVNTTVWASPNKASILERVISGLLPAVHNGCLLILPKGQFLLLLQHIKGDNLTHIVQELNRQLQPETNPQPATVQVMDLEHPNPAFLELCQQLANPTIAAPAPQGPDLSPDQLTTFKLDGNQLKIRRDRSLFRILIIEDDPATALLLSQLISNTGQVSVAHDSVHAIHTYKDLVPNLVLLDIGLPDVDGLTLAKRITTADPFAFVVMITANAFKNNLDASVAAGAKGFIAKPFNRERIQYYLNLAHQQKYQ